MAAGSKGLGGIPFEDCALANSVGSADLASILSDGGLSASLKLHEPLTATLPVENGSNDPMAIFLTLGLIGVISGGSDSLQDLDLLFMAQIGLGTVVGLAVGRFAPRVINASTSTIPACIPCWPSPAVRWPSAWRRREPPLLCWVGLKGAEPITPATVPLLVGIPNGHRICNAVIFVVLISAMIP